MTCARRLTRPTPGVHRVLRRSLSQQSTAAHAEERLVDRLFATADLLGLPPTKYNELLSRVVVYTSLQPCYQCTGKLIMAGVRHCVWIQDDPKIKVECVAHPCCPPG